MPKGHNKIVLDLEFNPIRDIKIKPELKYEIIEIAAVKLDDELNNIDTFDIYVKPEYNVVEEKITSLTKITNENLKDCLHFNDAMHEFINWIGEEPCTFYSWSNSDREVCLDEADFKRPMDSDYDLFYVHWVDLQKIYQRKMGVIKPMGLTNALGTLNIYFEGVEHGALADSLNTAEIMKVLADKEKFNSHRRGELTFNQSSHSSGFSGGIKIKTKRK